MNEGEGITGLGGVRKRGRKKKWSWKNIKWIRWRAREREDHADGG